MTDTLEADLKILLDWFEEENSLWVVVITGTGRVFCAGQDLKNWLATKGSRNSPSARINSNPHGFGSMARRRSKKVSESRKCEISSSFRFPLSFFVRTNFL